METYKEVKLIRTSVHLHSAEVCCSGFIYVKNTTSCITHYDFNSFYFAAQHDAAFMRKFCGSDDLLACSGLSGDGRFLLEA